MRQRGRQKIFDDDEIDRAMLKFLNPVRTHTLRLGYPTRRVWEYVNKFYRRKKQRKVSRPKILRRLMSLEERGFLIKVVKYHRYYWKGRHLRYAFGYEVGRFIDPLDKEKLKKAKEEYDLEYKRRFKEFARLGFDPHSPLDSLNDKFPFRSKDIISRSPQEFLANISLSLKQEIMKIMGEKEGKE